MSLDQITHPIYELKVDISNTSRLFEYYMLKDEIQKDDFVLDFGCNVGDGLDILSNFSDNVFGIDVIPKLDDILRKKYFSNSKVEYKIVEQGDFGYPERFFDIIIANNFIEHVNHPNYYLDNFKKLLKPNGFVVLTTVNRKHRLYSWQKPFNPHHVTEFSVSSLKELLANSFKNYEIYGISKRPPFFPDYYKMSQVRKFRNGIYWPLINNLKMIRNTFFKRTPKVLNNQEKPKELSLSKFDINDFQDAFKSISLDKENSSEWIELVAKCYK